jgi:protein arginine N-methyltransferase 5
MRSTNTFVRILAVEKNSNAIITLRNRIKTERWKNVKVFESDMRQWVPPGGELADILVSELLGSWGDNELSPECLDGAQKGLKPGGLSIPTRYTSFIAPISSNKLWMGARDIGIMQASGHSAGGFNGRPGHGLDTPYVVQFNNYHQLCQALPVFTFAHPNTESKIDNSRYESISFPINTDATIHGFSGTFHCTLFEKSLSGVLKRPLDEADNHSNCRGGGDDDDDDDVSDGHNGDNPSYSHADVNGSVKDGFVTVPLSIEPSTHTHNMFSWFPLFIPLATPLTVRAGDIVTVCIWRRVDARKTWYEWCLTSPICTPIQNSGGASYWIGL